jgi:hypothetical protein
LRENYKHQRDAVTRDKDRREKIAKINNNEEIDMMEANEEISYFTTLHLIEEAQRLIVPIPPSEGDEYWYTDTVFGRRHLTTAGVVKLRNDIRQERKARRDLPLVLLPMLIGLLGALTGLLAIILRK